MKRRGRPPGLVANPDTLLDALAGRSQRWLAEQAEMSVSHLNEVMSGRKGVERATADRLCEILKVRPGSLFPELAVFRVEARVFTVSGAEQVA